MTAHELASLVLLDGSLQAAVAGLALAALATLVRQRSAAVAHALVAVALVKFAIPPVVSFPSGVFTSWAVAVRFQSPDGGPSTFWNVFLAVWLAGAVVVASRRAHELVRLERIARRSTLPSLPTLTAFADLTSSTGAARTPRLRLTGEMDVPCTFHVSDPVILLPVGLEERLTSDELRGVLLHELGHVRRLDSAWNFLSSILGIIWWFHPVFHLVDRLGRVLREERCDEDVVTNGSLAPHEYAGSLLAVARFDSARRFAFVSGAGTTGHPLERRLRHIAAMPAPTPRRRRALAWITVALGAILVLPGAALRNDSPPDRTIFVHGPGHHHTHGH